MLDNRHISFLRCAAICVALCVCLISKVNAQDQFRVSAQVGPQMLNSDVVSSADNAGNLAWVFALGVSTKRTIGNIPVEYSLKFSHGQTEIIRQRNTINGISNSINLRYRTFTAEVMRVFELSDLIEISLGLNLVPQYRTILYDFEDLNPGSDRLLSFGLGISGKLSLIEAYSENRKMGLVFGIGARWTEFFLHNARNRQIDGFRYRHLIVSPHLGIRF